MSYALILDSGVSAVLRQQPLSRTMSSPSLCIAAAFRWVHEAFGLRARIEPPEKHYFGLYLRYHFRTANVPAALFELYRIELCSELWTFSNGESIARSFEHAVDLTTSFLRYAWPSRQREGRQEVYPI